MARVSASITPDLLLPESYNQQNILNGKGVDPGGGEEDIENTESVEVGFCCILIIDN